MLPFVHNILQYLQFFLLQAFVFALSVSCSLLGVFSLYSVRAFTRKSRRFFGLL